MQHSPRSCVLGLAIIAAFGGALVGEARAVGRDGALPAASLLARQLTDVDAEAAAMDQEPGPSRQQADLYYTGEKARPPSSLHPRIERFELPGPLAESVVHYLDANPLDTLDTRQMVAVALALGKCARLANLPNLLHQMGLDEVTVQPGTELAATCKGYTPDLGQRVAGALSESARQGDIPAILSLLHLLDPGSGAMRSVLENLEPNRGQTTEDLYREAHRLAYASIIDGNLYYAEDVAGNLVIQGTHGLPERQADGSLGSAPDRSKLIKGLAYYRALYDIAGKAGMFARYRSMRPQLSNDERKKVKRLADDLTARWLAKPVLYDSDIEAQGYWAPDLYPPE